MDPGEKERRALESGNCWEEEINIYIYRNWGLSQSLFDKKKKEIDMVKIKIELFGIIKQKKKKKKFVGNCKTTKEKEHVKEILTT